MTQTMAAEELTGLERLHLRGALQDAWQHQIRRLTLLALAMYDDPDAAEPVAAPNAGLTPADAEAELSATRQTLSELEAAMQHLDDGSYGRCQVCRAPIGFPALISAPLQATCHRCPVSTAAACDPVVGRQCGG